ncbi:peroxisome biogenesis factor 6 [Mixophyes fleayi]|uniref:peroxisome biogenesis factor 6 n=1 Tax=Mixophyes fleayi TaxID=3061075 RepID=UPI003F4D9C22
MKMPADQTTRGPGGPLLFVRTRGPLTPRRLLLSSPPVLDWVLLGVQSRRAPLPRGPQLVRRGEVLPECGALIADTRPTLQGMLGPHTRMSVFELNGENNWVGGDGRPQGGQEDMRPQGGQEDMRPQGGQEDMRPQGGQEDMRPQGGQEDMRPQGGQEDMRPLGGQEDMRPLGGQEDMRPQGGQEDMRPLGGQEDMRPLGGQEDMRPLGGQEDMRPLGGQEDMRPLGGQEDMRPQGGQEDMRPLGEQEDMRPQGGQEDMRPLGESMRPLGGQGESMTTLGGQKGLRPQRGQDEERLKVRHKEGKPHWMQEGSMRWGNRETRCNGGQTKLVKCPQEESVPIGQHLGEVAGGSVCAVSSPGGTNCRDFSLFGSDLHTPVVSSFARGMGPLRLRVAPVDAESLVRAGRLQEVGGPLDRGSALWVSKNQLRELGLFHREWVWVSLPVADKSTSVTGKVPAPVDSLDGGRKQLAMILAAELWLGHPHKYSHLLSTPNMAGRSALTNSGSTTGGTAVISASLSFNLTSGTNTINEVLIERFSNEPTEGSRSCLVEPPFAKALYIDVVKSPCYRSEDSFNNALYQHFQTPRSVQVGDVLCVSCLSHDEFLHNKSQIPVRCPDLYFKVRRIEGQDGEPATPGYLADSTHTTLYQVGTIHSFVPSFPSRDGHVFWSSLSPAGLSHVVDDVCRILQPHLQNMMDVLGVGGRVLLCGPKGSGKVTVVRAVCSRLNVHLLQVECARLCRESSAGCVTRLRTLFSRARDCRPCVLLLCHVDLLGRERDGSGEDARDISTLNSLLLEMNSTNRDFPFLVVATTSRLQDIPLDLHSCFLHEVSLKAPSEEHRLSLLTALTAPLPLSRDVNIRQLARRTAGFVVGDLCALLSRAGRLACARIRNSCVLTEADEEGLLTAGFPIISLDLENALSELQEAHSQEIGAPKVPCVRWKDVGGLQDAKRQLLDTVQLPLEHPEILSLEFRRSGILLYGPPGTGKTLLAKAVATECDMTFLSVKGPELINMYVGQSEENVREVFSRGRAAAPCIIFFDELDSLAPNRGKSGDSGGVMDRVVSQLLAEMDGLHSSNDVFVIGATNRPDLLDSALLRPGRFDKLVYVGVNEDRDSQLKVLEAITRKFSLDPAVDLSLVLEYCPSVLSGADLYALCADAMMSAVKEKVKRLQDGVEETGVELLLRMEHLFQAAERLHPSVSPQEIERYERVHKQFSTTSTNI